MQARRRSRRTRTHPARLLALALAPVAPLAAACAEPEYQYPHDAQEGVYFKVPRTWTVFDETESFFDGRIEGGAAAQPVRVWVLDADPDPDPLHLDDPDRDLPVGVMQIVAIAPGVAENVSIAAVRSLGFEFDPAAPAVGLEERWEVSIDQPVRTEDGLSGSIVVFNYRDTTDDPWRTQAREVVVDPTRQRVYLLDVFCSASCFQQYEDDILGIVDSWRIDL